MAYYENLESYPQNAGLHSPGPDAFRLFRAMRVLSTAKIQSRHRSPPPTATRAVELSVTPIPQHIYTTCTQPFSRVDLALYGAGECGAHWWASVGSLQGGLANRNLQTIEDVTIFGFSDRRALSRGNSIGERGAALVPADASAAARARTAAQDMDCREPLRWLLRHKQQPAQALSSPQRPRPPYPGWAQARRGAGLRLTRLGFVTQFTVSRDTVYSEP